MSINAAFGASQQFSQTPQPIAAKRPLVYKQSTPSKEDPCATPSPPCYSSPSLCRSPRRAQSAASDKPFVVEYYYKTKWGHADEFLKLFKKNHYPVLKKESEMGRITKVWMDQPRYHTTEDGRWDFRVTIVFKNATVANEPFDEAALQKQMYPDQETFQREEQRRFEILDAHWDSADQDGRSGRETLEPSPQRTQGTQREP